MHLIRVYIAATTIFIWMMLSSPISADTRVGSGGETAQLYIEQIYARVSSALQQLQAKPTIPGVLADFCSKAPDVKSADQATYCENFILSMLDSIQELMTREPAIPLLSWKDKECRRLKVGSDQVDWPLEAKTPLGPEGPICFNHKKITGISPDRLFTLIFHELGHKVSFEGDYIRDSELVGPFKGFQLLTVAGYALSQWALSEGIIRPKLFLFDSFSCEITTDDSSEKWIVQVLNLRKFLNVGSYDNYETGFGDYSDYNRINLNKKRFAFALVIHEELGCHKKATSNQRYLHFGIVDLDSKDQIPDHSDFKKQPRNPLCENGEAAKQPFGASYQGYQISCVYKGSVYR